MRGGVFVQKENQDKNGENEALNRADEIEKSGSVTMESGRSSIHCLTIV